MNTVPDSKIPNYDEVIREILSTVNDLLSTEELAAQILQRRPSNAKNPHQVALKKIREVEGRQLVYLDAKHILPLRLAYQGARYRIRLTKKNVDQTALSIYACFDPYLSLLSKVDNLSFVDSRGNSIPFRMLNAPHTVTFTPDENVEYHDPVVVLKEWFHSQKIYHKDHILVTIEDWERGVFRLERERFSEQRLELLAEQNRYFADAFYELLESARYEDIDVHVALPTVYARIPEKDGYPPDHWKVIVNQDPRMIASFSSIRYSDNGSSLFDMAFEEASQKSLTALVKPVSKEEGQQVYRFRVFLNPQPTIWREIEIQGRQTLAELDDVIRIAFQHNTSDHLSGFWRKVVRAGTNRKRYREVDLATINPFESGEGSDSVVASLKLQLGDQLKYVYDFGDWIEHTLELKSINNAEEKVDYPRKIARNKPKYEYCVECQKKGTQSVATWICYTCTNEEQQDIILCENCLSSHEDHELVELLY